MTTHAVSKSLRSAIWFDIYETMLCFAVSRAVVSTLLPPRARRAFVVTPKGERMPGAPLLNRLILLHLVLFGPLAVGVAVSLIRAAAWDFSPGMAISVFWAAVNLLLLGAVISTAYKPPQRQQCVRVPLYLPCEVLVGNRRLMGVTSDLSEAGAQLVVPELLEASADGLFVRFLPEGEAPISVRGMGCSSGKRGHPALSGLGAVRHPAGGNPAQADPADVLLPSNMEGGQARRRVVEELLGRHTEDSVGLCAV